MLLERWVKKKNCGAVPKIIKCLWECDDFHFHYVILFRWIGVVIINMWMSDRGSRKCTEVQQNDYLMLGEKGSLENQGMVQNTGLGIVS